MVNKSKSIGDTLSDKLLINLGNISGKAPEGSMITVLPDKHICTPELALKAYAIGERDMGQSNILYSGFKNVIRVLKKDIKEGMIAPHSGLGFAIYSGEIFNVCRWSDKDPDVIVPKIYALEKGLWKPQKVDKVGAFCSEEGRVYNHESKAWLQFLKSRRFEKDKRAYLEDFFKPDPYEELTRDRGVMLIGKEFFAVNYGKGYYSSPDHRHIILSGDKISYESFTPKEGFPGNILFRTQPPNMCAVNIDHIDKPKPLIIKTDMRFDEVIKSLEGRMCFEAR